MRRAGRRVKRHRRESGFTLIELMIVVAIIGVLSAIAVPSFIRYIKKSKTTEARMHLEKIYNGARAYYYEEFGGIDLALVSPSFPANQAPTPGVSCCTLTGSERCLPDSSVWGTATWDALKFSMDDPHYYQYAFVSAGTGNEATFTARALGDLDCDGEFSTFEMWGDADFSGGDPAGSAAVYRIKELE